MAVAVALLALLVEADVGVGSPSGNMGPHASGMHFVPCVAGARLRVFTGHLHTPLQGSPHDVLLSSGTVLSDCVANLSAFSL